MAYDNTNTGVLFIKKERKSDKAPNFEGRINVEGKDFDIAGWTRVTSNGDKFLSLKISEPYKKGAKKEEIKTVDVSDLGDELPFNDVP